MKKIFFDSEFTGLHQNTTLISIGLISDDNNCFYAEFTDYNKNQLDQWIIENVISKLYLKNEFEIIENIVNVKGNKIFIRNKLIEWILKQSKNSKLEFWSDCLSYDWVLFNQLFENKLLDCIYYIPFDICTLFKIKNIDPDISREKFSKYKNIDKKHNALIDAKIIKMCYEKLNLL